MSYSANIVTIFISSPGDVPGDRELIIRTINGWNQRNGKSRTVFFQPLTWEQVVAPDRGKSGQEVIDQQIGETYDIYLGLMWSRFGSATDRADSGTEDEFDQAIARHDAGEGLTISFLFKNSPIPQDLLDGLQFDKIQKFKKRIASNGCLYRVFDDDASLIDAVNLILDRFANDYGEDRGGGSVSASRPGAERKSSATVGVKNDTNEELGLFDLREILESESKKFTLLMGDWSAKLEAVGEKAEEASMELNSISRFGEIDPKVAKIIINRVAKHTESLVEWGEENQPLIEDSMERFVEAFSGLNMISGDFDHTREDLASAINDGELLLKSVLEANTSLEGLAKTVLSIPRVSKDMIKANKKLALMLDRMIGKNKTFYANIEISIDELRQRLANSPTEKLSTGN